ncbi:MAG: exo-alpha-sialidase [Thermoguttaceae bacterium]
MKLNGAPWGVALLSVFVCGLAGRPAVAADHRQTAPAATVIDDCEFLEASRTIWTLHNVTVSLSDQHVTSGKSSLKLELTAADGGFELNLPTKPLDWSRYKALSFDVFNASEKVIEFRPRIDDAWSEGFRDRFEPCDQLFLPPGKITHLQIDIDDLQANNFRLLDTSRITRVSFGISHGDGPRGVLYVDSFRLLPLPTEDLAKIVPDAVEPRVIDDGRSAEKSRLLWQGSDAKVEALEAAAVPAELHARSALKATFHANKEWSGMKIECKPSPMDWRGYKTLCFDAFNPNDRPLVVNIRIDDLGAVGPYGRFEVSDVSLPPGKKSVQIDIWRMLNMAGRKMDKSKIVLFTLFTGSSPQQQVLYVSNLRLGVNAGGRRNELRPGRIPGETPATLGKRLLQDPEIQPLIPIFKAMGPHKMAICSHSASISIHWSTSGAFFDVAAEAIRTVNPAVEYKGFHAGGMGAPAAIQMFLKAMQEYKPTDAYFLVVPDFPAFVAQQKLIDDMKAVGSRVFVFDAVKPWGAYSSAQTESLRKLCKDRGAPFIELMARGYGAPRCYKWTTTDTIHMTTEGHMFYARELLKDWAKIYGPAPQAGSGQSSQAIAPAPKAGGRESSPGILWDPSAPVVHRNYQVEPAGLRRVTVHLAVHGEFQFLSGPCIVAHKGRLFACWTNSPSTEDPDHECVRGRWSADGGLTWGPVQLVAGNATPQASYGHGTIFSNNGTLRVFAARFLRPKGAKEIIVNMDAVVYDDAADRWQVRGTVAEKFWAMNAPQRRPGGGWILGGDYGIYPGQWPAVALIDALDSNHWQTVSIPLQYDQKKDDKPPFAMETTLWITSSEVTALIRNPYRDIALLSYSHDGGRSWSPVVESNFPMAEERAYAGTLSTGQRYLVSNCDNRQNLLLAVGKPGATTLSKSWIIRKGLVPARWPKGEQPGWTYPTVTENDGKLYITYAAAREDCEMAIIPVASLAVGP